MPRVRRPLLALIALIAALGIGYAVEASRSDAPSAPASPSVSSPAPGGLRTVPLTALPSQVAATVRLVRDGGPFPYPRNDGVVFHNAERHLPAEPDGWYHEYTVPTPGSPDRGARRLVVGRDGRYFYTGDHYGSFVVVAVGR